MSGYISEIDMEGGAASNFIEVAVPTGTDTSAYTIVIYDKNGLIVTTLTLGSVVTTVAGQDIYLIDDTDPDFIDIGANQAIALVDDTGTALQFLSFNTAITAVEGPADGIAATELGVHGGATSSLETTDSGGSYSVNTSETPGTIPCYAPGTLIDTPDGLRAVETLLPGDLVLTVDNGPQPIRWTRSGDCPLDGVETEGKPVFIQAGALGMGLPVHDLIVSPQHRILVGGHGQLSSYFDREAFAPAKALTRLPGIRHMKGRTGITWIHFACDRHEVIRANGCLSESLLLGQMVVNQLPRRQRQTVTDIFGPALTPGEALNGPPARECLNVGPVRQLLTQSSVNEGKKAKEFMNLDVGLVMDQYEAELMQGAKVKNQPHECREA